MTGVKGAVKLTPMDKGKHPILKRFLEGAAPLQSKLRAVYLFGSRARGNERPDSDYDLLLVAASDFTLEDKSRLYDTVMDVLLETGRLVSLKIFKEKEFQRLVKLHSPFTENVLKEGIRIG